MFTKAGDFKVKIIGTCLSDPKFESAGTGAFDVCLHLQDVADSTQSEWWHGEMSQNYGKGSFSDRTQAQITLGTLEKIGFVGGQDMTRLDELIGKETIAHVDSSVSAKDGKTYFNVKWIGGGGAAPTAISKDEVKRRMAALMGGTPAPATQSPAQRAAPAKPTGKIPPPF